MSQYGDARALATALVVALDAIDRLLGWIEPFISGDCDETVHRLIEDDVETALANLRAVVRQATEGDQSCTRQTSSSAETAATPSSSSSS